MGIVELSSPRTSRKIYREQTEKEIKTDQSKTLMIIESVLRVVRFNFSVAVKGLEIYNFSKKKPRMGYLCEKIY